MTSNETNILQKNHSPSDHIPPPTSLQRKNVFSEEILAPELVEQRRITLFRKISELCSVHGWIFNGKEQVASVSKILLSHLCERRIKFLLMNKKIAQETMNNFDPAFAVRSEFVKRQVIQRLITILSEALGSISVTTEVKAEFGKYDVVVVYNEGKELARIEIKGSRGFDYEQIERYVWEQSSPLILIRVIMGQVTKILPSDGFVLFSLNESLSKTNRLLSDSSDVPVPGPYCKWCPHVKCTYNEGKRSTDRSVLQRKLIKQTDEDFQTDTDLLFSNLQYVCEKASEMILEEFQKSQPKKN